MTKNDIIYEDNKSLRFMMRLSVFMFVITLLLNVIAPIQNRIFHPDFFNLLVIGFWIYGLLSSLGYFKKPVLKEGNRTEYITAIPIVQIGLVRLVQALWHWFVMHGDIQIGWFIALIVIDIAYIMILLLDKSSYYYESVERETPDYKITIESDDSED